MAQKIIVTVLVSEIVDNGNMRATISPIAQSGIAKFKLYKMPMIRFRLNFLNPQNRSFEDALCFFPIL